MRGDNQGVLCEVSLQNKWIILHKQIFLYALVYLACKCQRMFNEALCWRRQCEIECRKIRDHLRLIYPGGGTTIKKVSK